MTGWVLPRDSSQTRLSFSTWNNNESAILNIWDMFKPNLLYLHCFFFFLGARMSSWQLSSAGTRWPGPSPRWGRGRCRGPQQAGNTRHSHRNSQSPSLSDLSVPSLLLSSRLSRVEEKTLTDIKSNLLGWGRLILTAGASCRASLILTRLGPDSQIFTRTAGTNIDSHCCAAHLDLVAKGHSHCKSEIRNQTLASNFLSNPYTSLQKRLSFSAFSCSW